MRPRPLSAATGEKQPIGPRVTPTRSSVRNAKERGYPTMKVSSPREIYNHNAMVEGVKKARIRRRLGVLGGLKP